MIFLSRVDKHTELLHDKGVHVGLDAFPCEITTSIDALGNPLAIIKSWKK